MPLKQKGARKFRDFSKPVSYLVSENRERLKDALNVFSNQGRLETRFGRSVYNSTLLAGSVLSVSFFKNANGERSVLAKVGTTLYKVASTGAHTAVKTGLSLTTKHRVLTFARGSSSRQIIAIEGDGLFQWNGTTFGELSQNPPIGFSVVNAASGSLTVGTYKVHLTYYSSSTGYETSATISSSVTTTASQKISVTGIPATATNPTIDKIRLYLENTASVEPALFSAEIALGSTSWDISTMPDSTETYSLANGVHPAGGAKYLAEFNGSLVTAGNSSFKNDVFFSEQDLPEAFNDGSAPDRLVHYAKGNGDISGIATGLYNNSVLDPYLVIFKNRSIEIFSGIAEEYRTVQISNQIGCVSADTISVKNGDVYFLSDNGWRVISNGRLVTDNQNNTITLGLGDIDDIFRQPGFTYEVNKSYINNTFSVYYSTLDQYLTWVAEGANVEYSKTYAYDFKLGGFMPYVFNTPSTAACIGEDSSGAEVVFMADKDGAIYTHSVKETKGSDADKLGVAQGLEAFALLPWIDGDDMDASFNWRELLIKRVAGSGSLEVRVWINYDLDSQGASYTFSSPASGFVLDVDSLDVGILLEAGRSIETVRADINKAGENILIGFYQNELGSSLGLVAVQVESNKNGNRNK